MRQTESVMTRTMTEYTSHGKRRGSQGGGCIQISERVNSAAVTGLWTFVIKIEVISVASNSF